MSIKIENTNIITHLEELGKVYVGDISVEEVKGLKIDLQGLGYNTEEDKNYEYLYLK